MCSDTKTRQSKHTRASSSHAQARQLMTVLTQNYLSMNGCLVKVSLSKIVLFKTSNVTYSICQRVRHERRATAPPKRGRARDPVYSTQNLWPFNAALCLSISHQCHVQINISNSCYSLIFCRWLDRHALTVRTCHGAAAAARAQQRSSHADTRLIRESQSQSQHEAKI